MNKNQTEYIRKSISNKPCKWKSIALTNLAATFTCGEAHIVLDALLPKLIAEAQRRVDRLTALSAPAIILDSENKKLAAAKRGVHPDIAPLKRMLV